MIDTNRLSADVVIANVERYLAQQYDRRQAQQPRPVRQTRRDGLVVIAAWVVVVWMLNLG